MTIGMFSKVALAGFALMIAQSVSAATYDFKDAADAGGGIGESIFSTFTTSASGGAFAGFAGPNLDITASAGSASAYVYFDNGGAGIGVCKAPNSDGAGKIGTYTNGSANLCDPGSDDGITAISEALTFTATETVLIESIWMNANHDSPLVTSASYEINGDTYTFANMVAHSISGTGDVRIDLGFVLNAGDSFSLVAVGGTPDSYISGIALTAVPVPAAGLLLLGALGGLGVIRRRRRRT